MIEFKGKGIRIESKSWATSVMADQGILYINGNPHDLEMLLLLYPVIDYFMENKKLPSGSEWEEHYEKWWKYQEDAKKDASDPGITDLKGYPEGVEAAIHDYRMGITHARVAPDAPRSWAVGYVLTRQWLIDNLGEQLATKAAMPILTITKEEAEEILRRCQEISDKKDKIDIRACTRCGAHAFRQQVFKFNVDEESGWSNDTREIHEVCLTCGAVQPLEDTP